jgi:integrase/recombinase XerD
MAIQLPDSELSKAFKRWKIHLISRGNAERTVKEYERHIIQLAVYMDQHYPGISISDIKMYHLDEFRVYLRTEHVQFSGHVNRDGKGDEVIGLSVTSINIRTRTIKQFWNWMKNNDYTTSIIVTGIKLLSQDLKEATKSKIAKTTDVDKVFEIIHTACLRNSGAISEYVRNRDSIIITLLYKCGFRITELLKIKGSDLEKADGGHVIRLKSENTKTRKGRGVPIPNDLNMVELLHHLYKSTWGYEPDALWEDVNKTNYFFVVEATKKPLNGKAFWKRLNIYAGHANIAKLHPHMLRHTFASEAVKKMRINTVRDLLGHSDISTTNKYLDEEEDVVFNEFWGSDKK